MEKNNFIKKLKGKVYDLNKLYVEKQLEKEKRPLNTEYVCNNSISLPIYPEIEFKYVKKIVKILNGI